MEKVTRFGIAGLGAMGGNLALAAIDKGYEVIGVDAGPVEQKFIDAGIVDAEENERLGEHLETPRVVFTYVPAGPLVDTVIDKTAKGMEPGDIIVDGGNSYWGDSIRRARRLREEHGIHLLDCGTSGGVDGARHGACFMFGGDKEAADIVMPILQDLATEGGVVYTGKTGSGHYTKLVHNGIEFGMLQAIGEGMDLLTQYEGENLNIPDILHCWTNGSVIRSWLVELMEEVYREKGGFEKVPPFIEDTGEVNWLVKDAMEMEVSIPVIAQSVMQLITSRDDKQTWARAIAMMRHGFGGHPFGEDEAIKKEREEGQVKGFVTSFDGEEKK